MNYKIVRSFAAIFLLAMACSEKKNDQASQSLSPDSARIIAKEAWVYGFPMFYNYRTQYLYALDKNYADYAGFNTFKNYGKSFTYADTAVVTPNNDTPYSWAVLNLTDEPIVLEVPAVQKDRYYVMQLVDLYTYNFAYVGTRSTGNEAGKYLIAGPDWNGEKPEGIDSVFHCETNLVTVLGRTELESVFDMPNVIKVQSQYRLTPLHEYTKQSAPVSKSYTMPLPEWREADYKSFQFISVLNSLLQYTSVDASETELRRSFAKIGIVPGQPFDSTAYSPEVIAAIKEGIRDGEKALKVNVAKTTSSLDLFGTRAYIQNDYIRRATAAAMGLFGNTKEEAVYEGSMLDNNGQPLTGDKKYTLRFTKSQLPSVKFFWSITMYSLPKRYLVQNPIDRYSIGDRTKGLKYEANGDLVIYIQSSSPGKSKEGNWLPSPANGPFNYVVRMYGPGELIISGAWKQPLPELAN